MSMQNKKLSMFGFFTLTASMLMSSDEYAVFAETGLQAVMFLVLSGILWFLPVALCSAEMATIDGISQGGVYAWVGKFLGKRLGFLAIFFQWFQVTVSFITMVYFIIGAISYTINFPALNDDPALKSISFLLIYWGATWMTLKGINRTADLVKWCFIIGIIIPSLAHFGLAIYYILNGGQIMFDTSVSAIFPKIDGFGSLAVVLPFVLAYSGIEASASHINEMENPRRDYPIVLMLIVIMAIVFDSLGGLTIATVIPTDQLSMNTGVVQGFEALLNSVSLDLNWIIKIVSLLLALGMFGEISSWIVGPVRGLYATAQINIMPSYFAKTNKDNVPVRLVVLQGIVVSILAVVITMLGGNGNAAFKLAISLTVMAYLVTYILIFVAYLTMITKHNDIKRGFHIRGGKIGKYTVSTIGLITSILIFLLSFLPNNSDTNENTVYYVITMIIGFLVVLAIPLIIYRRSLKRNHHTLESANIHHFKHFHINKWIVPKARGEFYWDDDNKEKK